MSDPVNPEPMINAANPGENIVLARSDDTVTKQCSHGIPIDKPCGECEQNIEYDLSKQPSDEEREIYRRIIEYVSGVQTGNLSHLEASEGLLELIKDKELSPSETFDYERLKQLELRGIKEYQELHDAEPLTIERVVAFINQLSPWNLKTTGVDVVTTLIKSDRARILERVESELVKLDESPVDKRWDCPCGATHEMHEDNTERNNLRYEQRIVLEALRNIEL